MNKKVLDYVKKIRDSDYQLIALFFILIFITRLPGIIILESENEPGFDGAYYHNSAENLLEGNGEISTIKNKWYIDWEDNVGKINTPIFVTPLYIYLLAMLFKVNNSLLAIRILNIFLTCLFLFIYYFFIKKSFDRDVAIFSSFLLIINPLLYLYSISLMRESLYLFLIIAVFYLISFSIHSYKSKFLILAGIVSGMAFLTRITGLFLIGSIFLWLILYKKKVQESMFYVLVSVITIVPWLLNNYMTHGFLLPYLYIHSDIYPTNIDVSFHFRTLEPIAIWIRFESFFGDISSINGLFLLTPFVIMGFIRNRKEKLTNLFIVFTLITLLYHVGHHYVFRYLLPIIPLCIPVGIREFMFNLEKLKQENMLSFSLKPKEILSVFLVLVLVANMFFIPINIIDHYVSKYYDNNEEKYDWINDTSYEVIGSTTPQQTNYFTKKDTVLLDHTHDFLSFESFIEEYNIDLLVFDNHRYSLYQGNDFLVNFFESDMNQTFVFDNFILKMIELKKGEKYTIKFFEVEWIK